MFKSSFFFTTDQEMGEKGWCSVSLGQKLAFWDRKGHFRDDFVSFSQFFSRFLRHFFLFLTAKWGCPRSGLCEQEHDVKYGFEIG